MASNEKEDASVKVRVYEVLVVSEARGEALTLPLPLGRLLLLTEPLWDGEPVGDGGAVAEANDPEALPELVALLHRGA